MKTELNFRESFLNLKNNKLSNYHGQGHDEFGGKLYYTSLTKASGSGYYTSSLIKKVSSYRTDIKGQELNVADPLDFNDILVWIFNPYEYHNYENDFKSDDHPVVTLSLHKDTGCIFIDFHLFTDSIDIKAILSNIRSGFKNPDMGMNYRSFPVNIDEKACVLNYELNTVSLNTNGFTGSYIPVKKMIGKVFVKEWIKIRHSFKVAGKHQRIYIDDDEITAIFSDEQGGYPIRLMQDIPIPEYNDDEKERHDVGNDIKVTTWRKDNVSFIFTERDLRKTNYFHLIRWESSSENVEHSHIEISEEMFQIDFEADSDKVREFLRENLRQYGGVIKPTEPVTW